MQPHILVASPITVRHTNRSVQRYLNAVRDELSAKAAEEQPANAVLADNLLQGIRNTEGSTGTQKVQQSISPLG